MESFLNSAALQARLALAACAVGIAAGCASAAFLSALDAATELRLAHAWMLALLPAGGFAIGWLYWKSGGRSARGTELIVEEIHRPEAAIPLRMAPMVFIGSAATHLFGGSAGREGAAVQMAGSLGDQVARLCGFGRSENRSILLMASLAAGFGSVFGTPLAGAIFGMEAPARGRLRLDALFSCALASCVGHAVTIGLGIEHVAYPAPPVPEVSMARLGWIATEGVGLGLLARAFAFATEMTAHEFYRRVSWPPLRPAIGGVAVALIAWSFDADRALGLGVPAILESMHGWVPPSDFAWKAVLTALTLGSGFKGGEVTPLFFMGATGGNAFARLAPATLGLGAPFFSAVGFVAAFAGAARVPFTCIAMAAELFGQGIAPFAAAACLASYLASGQNGGSRRKSSAA